MRIASVALAVCMLAGCNLYFHGGDDGGDDVCYGAYEAVPYDTLRNPQTGACQEFGGGGCGYCTPCVYKEPARPTDWASCYTQCEALDESACFGTSGCRAAYVATEFAGCWATAPSGPISTGTCEGLDAQACSQHDNCAAYYLSGTYDTEFDHCAAEPSNTCAAIDCGSGSHCEQQCTASECTATCVPDELCESTTCDPGTVCVETCTEGSGPHTCTTMCVPDGVACETLTLEADCVANQNCVAVYLGEDCTCTSGGCTCATETWDHCQTGVL